MTLVLAQQMVPFRSSWCRRAKSGSEEVMTQVSSWGAGNSYCGETGWGGEWGWGEGQWEEEGRRRAGWSLYWSSRVAVLPWGHVIMPDWSWVSVCVSPQWVNCLRACGLPAYLPMYENELFHNPSLDIGDLEIVHKSHSVSSWTLDDSRLFYINITCQNYSII